VIPSSGIGSVGGGACYDQLGQQFILAYGLNNGSGAFSGSVTFDRYLLPSATPWSTSGLGCSSATISWAGSQLIGSNNSRVRVNGASANAIHLLVLATAPPPAPYVFFGLPPFVNGCWLLVPSIGPDYLGIIDVQVGSSLTTILPLPEQLNNMTLYFQDFHTDASGNFSLLSTKRLDVPLVKCKRPTAATAVDGLRA
jgi:hypothetical protein